MFGANQPGTGVRAKGCERERKTAPELSLEPFVTHPTRGWGLEIGRIQKAEDSCLKFESLVFELGHWAEGRGPLLHARIGMLRAMHHGVERVFRSDRKETRWGKRKWKRNQ
jgi:hypothetical protein